VLVRLRTVRVGGFVPEDVVRSPNPGVVPECVGLHTWISGSAIQNSKLLVDLDRDAAQADDFACEENEIRVLMSSLSCAK
jgi:hypothetical protein